MIDNDEFKCKECDKAFANFRNLTKHKEKKRKCHVQYKCPKCDNIFKYKSHYDRHMRRKTPCEPVLGDPTVPLENPNTCRYCGRIFKYKKNLKRHFRACKIRNGNMTILFQKIEEKQKELEKNMKEKDEIIRKILEEKKETKEINIIGTINNSIDNSTHINIVVNNNNLVNFGSIAMEDKVAELLETEAKKILYAPLGDNKDKEIKKRITDLVKHVYRNPQVPEMQNIFTTGTQEHIDDWKEPEPKTYCWNKEKWNSVRLDKVGKYISHIFMEGFPDNLSGKKDIYKIKKKFDMAMGANPQRERPEAEMTNRFFEEPGDPRDEIDMLFLYIALALDRDGLLEPQRINKSSTNFHIPR